MPNCRAASRPPEPDGRRHRGPDRQLSRSHRAEENIYDAIVTDPPYSISLHGYSWDTDISFSPELWTASFGC